MRELILRVTCDKCEKRYSEEEVVNVEMLVSDEPSKKREIDLCRPCLAEFIRGSRVTGRKVRKNAAKAAPQEDGTGSYECSCGNTYKTPRGLQVHQKRAEH